MVVYLIVIGILAVVIIGLIINLSIAVKKAKKNNAVTQKAKDNK